MNAHETNSVNVLLDIGGKRATAVLVVAHFFV